MATNGRGLRVAGAIDYQERIDAVLRYMGEHLDEPLTLQDLACVAGFSPFHFHRIYHAFAGESAAETFRRLRLQRAASALLETQQPITRIALDAGYETHSAFTRAFKQAYAVTPSTLRRAGEQARAPLGCHASARERKGLHMEPEFRTVEARRMIYAEGKGSVNGTFSKAAAEAMEILGAFIYGHGVQDQLGECFGYMVDDPQTVVAEEQRYRMAFFLKEGAEITPEGKVELGTMPGGRVAVFVHRGPYDTLWQSWDAAYHGWLPNSGETHADYPPYEVYIDDPGVVAPENLRTELHIPLK